MSYRNRLILVLVITAGIFLLLTFLEFHPHLSALLWRNDLIVAAAFLLGIPPIYPLYRSMRKRERVDALAILLLLCAIISGLIYLTGTLVLGVDAVWTSTVYVLSECLFIASCLLFVWNGFIRKNRR